MTAPLVIPFDHDPVATSIKSGSYAIPAGRYARVTPEIGNGGYITINGTIIFYPEKIAQYTNSTAAGGAGTRVAVYTVPSNFSGEICLSALYAPSGNSFFYLPQGNDTARVGVSAKDKIGVQGGDVIAIQMVATSDQFTISIASTNSSSSKQSIWLDPGDVLNGSGDWRAWVEEYSIIS